ncbi:MAG: hypothetical protein ACLGPL_09990 [Acidobacteriota bacterium]
MEEDSKLIPILIEGVEVVKMVFFRKLKSYLSVKYPARDVMYINRLSGAVINDLFGVKNQTEPFATFAEENSFFIREELKNIAKEFQEMRIPLTDALRIQFLCDHQEGVDSTAVLEQAKELGILIEDREVPLPARFLSLVRKLGSAFGILGPAQP